MIGKRTHSENYVNFYSDRDGNVCTVELLTTAPAQGKWEPPPRIELKEHRNDDWHGQASLWLPADMPDLEVARRLAIARKIHDPVTSQESCCIAKRKQLAQSEAA